MNKLKRYKLVHTTPSHFILHDGKAHFHIAKKGLDAGMIEQIQSLEQGGEVEEKKKKRPSDRTPASVEPEITIDPDKFKKLQEGMKNVFASGGEVDKKILSAFSSEDHFLTHNKDHGAIHPEHREDPYLPGYSMGGKIDHNNPSMEEEAQQLNTPQEDKNLRQAVQHFAGESNNPADQIVQPSPLLPADFAQQVAAEKDLLKSTQVSGAPDMSKLFSSAPQAPQEKDLETRAETNVAARFQQQQADQLRQAEQARIASENAIRQQADQLMADNAIRAKSGLTPLPVPQLPQQPSSSLTPTQMIPKEQQVSFAPQQSQQQMPKIDLVGPFEKNVADLSGAIQKNAELQAKGLAENARNIQTSINEQQQRHQQFEAERSKIDAENQALYQQVKDDKIDPNRLWNESSTGAKIAASLGLIFGGIGAGMTGQPNAAANYIEKAIANDIDAQKADTSNRMNLYKIGLERYRDTRAAEQFATLQSQAILAAQIQKTAAKIGSPQALEMAKQAIAELNLKYDPMKMDLALKQTALNYSQPQQTSQGQTGINTAKMTAFINAGLYDDATKKELVKEQADYIKAKNLLDETERVFKDAYANATWTNRLPGASHLPSFREKTKQYESAVNSYLDKMTKDLTGRVTPQSMANLHSAMPLVDDSPETVARKMNDMKDIIKSGYAFPTLQNKGLLNPADPVLQSTGNVQSKFTQGKPVLK